MLCGSRWSWHGMRLHGRFDSNKRIARVPLYEVIALRQSDTSSLYTSPHISWVWHRLSPEKMPGVPRERLKIPPCLKQLSPLSLPIFYGCGSAYRLVGGGFPCQNKIAGVPPLGIYLPAGPMLLSSTPMSLTSYYSFSHVTSSFMFPSTQFFFKIYCLQIYTLELVVYL